MGNLHNKAITGLGRLLKGSRIQFLCDHLKLSFFDDLHSGRLSRAQMNATANISSITVKLPSQWVQIQSESPNFTKQPSHNHQKQFDNHQTLPNSALSLVKCSRFAPKIRWKLLKKIWRPPYLRRSDDHQTLSNDFKGNQEMILIFVLFSANMKFGRKADEHQNW